MLNTPSWIDTLLKLSDGHFHSGHDLARQTGKSRSAIWKHIRAIRMRNLDVYAVHGRGYRLESAIELLDKRKIRKVLDAGASKQIAELTILAEVDSTNAWLKRNNNAQDSRMNVCIAEYQSAGKGRQGRNWESPLAANLYISLLRQFDCSPSMLSGLSLAVGVSLVRSLESLGVRGVGLKWPNDLWSKQAKLGGILVEIAGESDGPVQVVIGIGINGNLPDRVRKKITRAVSDLNSESGGQNMSRNTLAGTILNRLAVDLAQFEAKSFKPFMKDWRRLDVLTGKHVNVSQAKQSIKGRVEGVNGAGALILKTSQGHQALLSGEVLLS